jgi:hypothetical protein
VIRNSGIFYALFIICIMTNGINADGITQFGITGGTKGIGLKYSSFSERFGIDIGVPFYYKFENKTNDTTVKSIYDFKINSYFSFSGIFFKRQYFDLSAGIVLFVTVEYETKKRVDTVRTQNALYFTQKIGPCLQFIGKNMENDKMFSLELFPIAFWDNFKQSLDVSPNVQLNYYFKRKNKEKQG